MPWYSGEGASSSTAVDHIEPNDTRIGDPLLSLSGFRLRVASGLSPNQLAHVYVPPEPNVAIPDKKRAGSFDLALSIKRSRVA